jgi:hypothetical protein
MSLHFLATSCNFGQNNLFSGLPLHRLGRNEVPEGCRVKKTNYGTLITNMCFAGGLRDERTGYDSYNGSVPLSVARNDRVHQAAYRKNPFPRPKAL